MKNFEEHIEAYLEGRLKGEELAHFEQALKNDGELRKELHRQELAKKVALGFLEEEVRSVLEGMDDEYKVQPSRRFLRRTWSAAAGILIMILAGWYWFGMNDAPTWEYYDLYAERKASQERGKNDSLIVAVEYGRTGEIETAKRVILSLDTSIVVQHFWISELYAGIAEGDSVLHYLPSVEDVPRDFRDRILYLEILAYIAKKDWEKVRQLKDQLPEDMGEYYLRLLD